MITISFYSYKGGVGRSLALTNLGVYLAQFGARVVMIDFDLEAPGLQYKLQPGAPSIDLGDRSMARFLANVSRAGLNDLDLDLALDVTSCIETEVLPEPPVDQETGRLWLIPAGDPTSAHYSEDLGAIDWPQLFGSAERPGVVALNRLRSHLIETLDPDVILIDSRTGMTPSGGVATTLLPDAVVTVLLNTPEHIDGTQQIIAGIIRSATPHRPAPAIVPVLGRFTSASMARVHPDGAGRPRPQRRRPELGEPGEGQERSEALSAVHAGLTTILQPEEADRVDTPFVLHADLSLQHAERLTFGPHATTQGTAVERGGALLDDYLRLFAHLVPADLLTRHLGGVRNRVRAIILDRPDDAIRSLENLSALVNDEGVARDLIKLHVLRQDIGSAMSTAERFFLVHGKLIVEPAVTQAVVDTLLVRRGALPTQVNPEFAYAYWQQTDPNNLQLGIAILIQFATEGDAGRAEDLAQQILTEAPNTVALAEIVQRLALGNPLCERLAVKIALDHFSTGMSNDAFLDAAALAVRYRNDPALAYLIATHERFESIRQDLVLYVLLAAGKEKEAEKAFRTLIASDTIDVDVLADAWRPLIRRRPALRSEIEEIAPGLPDDLDGVD